MASLKASKQVAHAPSKAETILTDNQKLSFAPIVDSMSKAYQFGLDHERMTMSKGEIESASAESFVTFVKDNDLDYQSMQAFKKHVVTCIAIGKKQQAETVTKWLNKIVKGYLDLADLGNWTMPKAESKNAESMAKLRAELASINEAELKANIATLAMAGDKESLRQATQYASEIERRNKALANEAKRSESKATTELKGALKRWVTNLDHEQLVAMLWVKNHFNEVTKLAKQAK